MHTRRPSVLDELYGASALGALLAGDLEGAAKALDPASGRYLLAFLSRLALLMPGVALRLAVRTARRRGACVRAPVE